MERNAIRVEFKKPISVKIPPKGEIVSTSKLLLATKPDLKIIGFEVGGTFWTYGYKGEVAGELERIVSRHQSR